MKFGFMFALILTFVIFSDVSAQNFTKVKELGGITEYTLNSNGLTVLLKEDHSAPVLTFMVTYRVGSRNEVTGTTGATHLLEHLMFKGTKKFNKKNGGHIDALLGNVGAQLNASTWNDRTNYYEMIPSEYLELAIDIESDRMRNLNLFKEDKDAEMTVVRNEFERGKNSPFSSLSEEIWAAAFQAHPYHHPTIGWRSDIENVPIEKLRDFYNTFYYPNNATVTIVGDFQTDNALSLIEKYFGKIEKSPNPIPQLYTVEPEQLGPRRVEVNRAGRLGVVGIAHKVPAALNPDTYPLTVLSNILGSGKNSRLYKALVDKNKAVNVYNSYTPLRDPGLMITFVFLAPGVKHEEAEKITLDEFEKLRTAGVTEEEVRKAVNQIASETAYDRDGSFAIAGNLNEAIAAGDWTQFVTFKENILKVTKSAVDNVIKKYFVKNNRTTGYFIPKKTSGGNKIQTGNKLFDTKDYYRPVDIPETGTAAAPGGAENSGSISSNIHRNEIGGIQLFTAETGVEDVVTFRGSIAAGGVFNPKDNSMAAALTAGMLDKGTKTKDKFEIDGILENLGADISFRAGTNRLAFSGRCLKKDVEKVFALLAEELQSPAFTEEEFEKLKKQTIGSLENSLENTNLRASEKLDSLIFPENHPDFPAGIERKIKDAESAELNDVEAFHKKYYGNKSMIFVAVGDINENEIKSAVKNYFGNWTGGVENPDFKKAPKTVSSKNEIVFMNDKTSATLMIGQATGLRRTDADYIPLYIANEAFGGGSFTARLMSIIRDEEGLTYGIYSSLSGDSFSDGRWAIQGTFSPDLIKKGLESTERELKRWVRDGLTEEELQAVKSRVAGAFKVRLSTTRGMAGSILNFAELGYGPQYLDEFINKINSLSLKEVNKVIKKYIHPDKTVTVISGTVDENKIFNK